MNKYVDLIISNDGRMTESEFIEQSKDFNQKTPAEAWSDSCYGQAMAALGRSKITLPDVPGEVPMFFPIYNAEGEKVLIETTLKNIKKYGEEWRAFYDQKQQKTADQAIKSQNEQHLLEEQSHHINQMLFPDMVEPVADKVKADSMVEAEMMKAFSALDSGILHHSHPDYIKPGQYEADWVKIKDGKVVKVIELDSYQYHHARKRDHKKTAQRNAYYLKNKHLPLVIYADNVLRHGARKVAKWVLAALA